MVFYGFLARFSSTFRKHGLIGVNRAPKFRVNGHRKFSKSYRPRPLVRPFFEIFRQIYLTNFLLETVRPILPEFSYGWPYGRGLRTLPACLTSFSEKFQTIFSENF